MESNKFENELKEWMNHTLSPYCLNECKTSCCDCEGVIQIDKGYEHLFKTYKITGEKVLSKKENPNGPHLFKRKENGLMYFEGKTCPNFDPKNKKCLIHNEYPRCELYPIMKSENPEEGYLLFSVCSLHKLKESQEPLKSLIELCRKHGFKLTKEKISLH